MNPAEARSRAAFEAWFGEGPDHVFPATGSALSTLVFVDDDEDDEDDDEGEPGERTTYLVTAGLCARLLSWATGGSELVVCVVGDFDVAVLEPLAVALGTLAAAFATAEAEIQPGVMLETGPLPVFEAMDHLLFTSWSAEPLPSDPPIALLSANPITGEEAVAMSGMPEEAALSWLDENGVDVDDPFRGDATVTSPFDAEALAAIAGAGTSLDMATAMQRMTRGVESWMEANAPRVLEEMEKERRK